MELKWNGTITYSLLQMNATVTIHHIPYSGNWYWEGIGNSFTLWPELTLVYNTNIGEILITRRTNNDHHTIIAFTGNGFPKGPLAEFLTEHFMTISTSLEL